MIKGKKLILLSSLIAITFLSGCGGYDNEDKNIVGENLILTQATFKPVVDLTKEQIQAGLNQQAAQTGTQAQTALLGVKSYKIAYLTHDEQGKEVKASGLITIPAISPAFMSAYKEANKRDFSLSIVSDQHGTIFQNSEAPSVQASTTHMPNALATVFSGVAGFMTIQPDYLGFGDDNTSVHPYILEKPSANTTVDMIKAAIAFANKAKLPINGQVFLSGYSEGGYATMAAAKEIQENHPQIHLMAVAPMAGPYDVEQLGLGSLKAPVMPFPPFLADVVYAYSQNYSDLNLSVGIQDPYASKLPTLFDGTHSGEEIFMALPNVYTVGQTPDKLFKPEFIDTFLADSTNPLRVHFQENSVIDWTPKMPMRLYHCTNDAIIPYQLSQEAYASFTQRGSTTVELEPINTVEANATNPLQVHSNCAPVAYSQVIPWFDKVRKGEK